MRTSDSHRFSFLTEASAERVWGALTCAETTAQYLHGMHLESEWTPGARVTLRGPGGHHKRGEVIAARRPQALSFALEQGTAPCRIIGWELRPSAGGTVVRLIVDDIDGDRDDEIEDTWLPVLAGLQRLLASGTGG